MYALDRSMLGCRTREFGWIILSSEVDPIVLSEFLKFFPVIIAIFAISRPMDYIGITMDRSPVLIPKQIFVEITDKALTNIVISIRSAMIHLTHPEPS